MGVALVAVAGMHLGDGLVVGSVDLADPVTVAAGVAALPPGQDRLPLVVLHPEVRCCQGRGHRVEPDDTALAVDDQRPLLEAHGVRGEEQVALGVIGGVLGDGDDRRTQAGLGDERLGGAASPRPDGKVGVSWTGSRP